MFSFSIKHGKIFFTIAAIVLLVALLVFAAAMPLFGKVLSMQAEIKKNEIGVVEMNAQNEASKAVAHKLGTIRPELAGVNAIFPLREDTAPLIEAIEGAIARAGVSATLGIYDDSDQRELGGKAGTAAPIVPNLNKIEEARYTVRFSADHRDLVEFFLYLENLPFVTEVRKLTLAADYDDPSGQTNIPTKLGTATAEVDALLFIKKP